MSVYDRGSRVQLGSMWMIRRTDIYRGADAGRRSPDGWWRRAACANRGPYWTQSVEARDRDRYGGLTPAEQIAAARCVTFCPVMRECLTACFAERGSFTFTQAWGDHPIPDSGVWAGTTETDREGKTVEDVPRLLDLARRRAVSLGIAPRWIVTQEVA